MSSSPRSSSIEHLLANLPAVYFRQQVDGSFQYLGDGTEEALGLDRKELLADSSLLAAAIQQERPDLIPTPNAEKSCRVFQLWHARTGELKTIQEWRMPILNAEEVLVGYEGLWLDHTATELVEKRLEAGSWKELLCRITQGFTHDLNNALTGLMAMSELLVSQADEKHPFHDAVNVVRQSTLKAADLVRRLNQLLQSAPGKGEFSDAGITLTEALELLHKAVPRRVKVQQEITSEPLPVRADGWRLRLLLLQLVLNALEAMPEGGTLYIQAARSQAAPTGAPAAGRLPDQGPWVRVSVSDTGPAFKPHPETFQPWFGTKANQMGTGLGLFVARRFCQQHDGALFVDSREGLGTTIELWLKQADLDFEERPETRKPRLLLAGRDFAQISEVAGVCRGNGYATLVAPGPENVPRLLAMNASEFDGVILVGASADLKATLDWLRRERLQIAKVVLTDETEVAGVDLVMPFSDPQTFLRRMKNFLG